jgi:hypothetical protein
VTSRAQKATTSTARTYLSRAASHGSVAKWTEPGRPARARWQPSKAERHWKQDATKATRKAGCYAGVLQAASCHYGGVGPCHVPAGSLPVGRLVAAMAAGRSGSSLSGLLRVLRSPAVALTPPQSPAAALTPRRPALANRVHLDQVWPLRLLLVAHLTAGGRQLVGERAPAQPTCGGTRVPQANPKRPACVRCRSAPSQVGSQSDAQ